MIFLSQILVTKIPDFSCRIVVLFSLQIEKKTEFLIAVTTLYQKFWYEREYFGQSWFERVNKHSTMYAQ